MQDRLTATDYEALLKGQGVNMCYQPIVSIFKRRIVGVEALLRCSTAKGEAVSPEIVFSHARASATIGELDNICKQKALALYSGAQQDTLIFINFEASMLRRYIAEIDLFLRQVKKAGLLPCKIVIEINERSIVDNDDLIAFIDTYRRYGFLIALDDVGAGHSNLSRIALSQPDIVKIDRSVIENIHKDYYKREVVTAIASLSAKIGAICLAEGTERIEEIAECARAGIYLFQGFFFSKAVPGTAVVQLNIEPVMKQAVQYYRNFLLEDLTRSVQHAARQKSIFKQLCAKLPQRDIQRENIDDMMRSYPEIECVYFINSAGKQVTPTFFNQGVKFKNGTLFSPAQKGDKHTTKPYYYITVAQQDSIFVSEPYVSAATGNFCVTCAGFCDSKNEKYIMCVDFIHYVKNEKETVRKGK